MRDNNIIDYLEGIRKAYADNDKDQANDLAQEYGGQPATYKDVEEANAHTIQVLAGVVDTQKTLLNFKLDYILELLVENEVVPEDSINNLDEILQNTLEKIEKVANEDE